MAGVVDISTARPNRSALPHDLDAEASVLGGIILRNELIEKLPTLEIDDFYLPQHRIVFEAIRNLRAADRPIDIVTLEHEIERRGKLDAFGGNAGFFGELALRVPTADNVLAYTEIVQGHARNRRAIIGLSSALERARNWQHEPSEMISEVLGDLRRLEDESKPPAKRLRLISIGQALEELDVIARAPVYPTPFETVNDAIGFGGFLGTQVYTVAAGTGRGKTTWVAEVAAFAAQSVPVIVASYEMKPGYFVARKAAGVLGVHSNAIIRGEVSAGAVLQAMPYPRMFLMHKPTLRELREAVQFVCDKFGQAPLVVADYLQKLADEIALQQQRPDLRIATSMASATLLDIADRTGAAVVAVSAIGRGKAILRHPRKHEPYELVEVAKESGAVEYDGAGMIVLNLSNEYEGDERIGTMTVAKARFGREMHIEARYHGARGTWRDLGEVWASGDDKTTSSKTKSAAPAVLESSEDSVRARIVAELQKQPARNKTALKERVTGCRKAIVGALISRMIDEGVIAQIGDGLTLSPSGRQLVISPPSEAS